MTDTEQTTGPQAAPLPPPNGTPNPRLVREIAARIPPAPLGVRSSPAAIAAVVAEIAERFHPARIVLFGSRATGTARHDSDVDRPVVVDTPPRPLQQAAAIYRSIDHTVPTDILVRTPAQVATPDPRDLLLPAMLEEGTVVSEAAG